MNSPQSRIICISNRLPVSAFEEGSHLEFRPSSGGLVTAMGPVLRKSRGIWIGWPGAVTSSAEQVESTLEEFSRQSDFDLFPVLLDQDSVQGFYEGFSSQIVWPLFHDLQTRCKFEPGFWSTYLKVQGLFADEVQKRAQPADLVWIHDYHLMGLGRKLRENGMKNKLGFFFHTPFPGPDIFTKLPWRADVIDSMLSYDLIGFQTKRDLKNFTDCVELLTPSRFTARGTLVSTKTKERECLLGNFPISIDFAEFEDIARLPEVDAKAAQIRADINTDFIILSIDRLDYTKGIPDRIRAFRRLLEIDPSLKKRISLLQVVVPSRVEVPEYKSLRAEIDQLVSKVNGEAGEPGWVPVQHLFRSMTREDVIAMYRAADVALVTPLKDGMNLVCKEYCASRIHDDGALVLSEFAGAADEFRDLSALVNPYDLDGVANALRSAILMDKGEARRKMQGLRDLVRKGDVFSWASSYLNAASWEWPSNEAVPRPATVWDRLRRFTNVFDM